MFQRRQAEFEMLPPPITALVQAIKRHTFKVLCSIMTLANPHIPSPSDSDLMVMVYVD